MGLQQIRYPHRRTWFRTTTWKNTGIRLREDVMRLSRARGLEPLGVEWPTNLLTVPADAYKQVELVWDRAGRRYTWHVTLDDGTEPAPAPGDAVVAVDLGEIHPAALTDGKAAVVISARRLRAVRQHTAKRLAALRSRHDRKYKGSRRWKRLQRRKNRFLAQQKKRTCAIEHKVSRAVVEYATERKAGTPAIGDVRDVEDGKRMASAWRPRPSRRSARGRTWSHVVARGRTWSHGNVRQYIT
jgi:putative transposase